MRVLQPGLRATYTHLDHAPLWLQRNRLGRPLGSGAYAHTWRTRRGTVIKLTTDAATGSLFSRLRRSPCPGFPRVLHACALPSRRTRGLRQTLWALELEELVQLSAAERGALRRTYRLARARVRFCADKAAYSLAVLRELRRELRQTWPAQQAVQAALRYVAEHVRQTRANIDLLHPDNWMKTRSGELVLSDPVVCEAYEF